MKQSFRNFYYPLLSGFFGLSLKTHILFLLVLLFADFDLSVLTARVWPLFNSLIVNVFTVQLCLSIFINVRRMHVDWTSQITLIETSGHYPRATVKRFLIFASSLAVTTAFMTSFLLRHYQLTMLEWFLFFVSNGAVYSWTLSQGLSECRKLDLVRASVQSLWFLAAGAAFGVFLNSLKVF